MSKSVLVDHLNMLVYPTEDQFKSANSIPDIPSYGQQLYVMASWFDDVTGVAREQRLRLLLSKDCITWSPIGGIQDSVSARDPGIFFFNNTWYYSYTNGSGAVSNIKMRQSSDLTSWSDTATISTAAIGSVTSSWAGNCYIEGSDVYAMATVSRNSLTTFKPYLMKASSSDLTTWGAPVEITGTGFPAQFIGLQIVKIGSTYYLWAKDDVTDHEVIYSSSSLTSGYTAYHNGNWAGWGSGLEGGVLINTSGSNWMAVGMDAYVSNGLYYATSTDNLATFSSKAIINTQSSGMSNPSAMKLTTVKQYQDVLNLITENLGITMQSLGVPAASTNSAYGKMLWLGKRTAIYGADSSAGGAAGIQFFSNATISSFTVNKIDSTRPCWWMELAEGSDNCLALYHGVAGNNPDTLFFRINSSGYLFSLGIQGVTTNSNAAAGNVGETVSSAIAVGSAVALSTATTANVTSISLTAGDWDVSGNVNYSLTGATATAFSAGISTTSATIPTDGTECYSGVVTTALTAINGITMPTKRISLSATTTIYLVAQSTFTLGAEAAFGSITARRRR